MEMNGFLIRAFSKYPSRLVHLFSLLVLSASCSCKLFCQLPGFTLQPEWDEQTITFRFAPEIRIHINVPLQLNEGNPTNVIFYALPNGNTIEQTIGRQPAEGLDRHFIIQHIGAQTRRLREIVTNENIVIAYLETESKSFPQWRRKFANSGELIELIIDTVRSIFKSFNPTVTLTGHSGGGSFTFGYLNRVGHVPMFVKRIAFLDSNYSFEEKEGHGAKLIHWLQQRHDRFLTVLAYDDRFITLNGKRVVSDTGGTFRATHRMLSALAPAFSFSTEKDSAFDKYSALNKRVDIRIHTNPDTLILHTVLVEKNGFIHAITSGTPYEGMPGEFWGEVAYRKWIAK